MQVYLSRIEGTTESAASPDSAYHSTWKAPTGMPAASVEPLDTFADAFSPLRSTDVGRLVKSMTSESPSCMVMSMPTFTTAAPDASSTLMEGLTTSPVVLTSNLGYASVWPSLRMEMRFWITPTTKPATCLSSLMEASGLGATRSRHETNGNPRRFDASTTSMLFSSSLMKYGSRHRSVQSSVCVSPLVSGSERAYCLPSQNRSWPA